MSRHALPWSLWALYRRWSTTHRARTPRTQPIAHAQTRAPIQQEDRMRTVLLLTAVKWVGAIICAGIIILGPSILVSTITGGWG